MRWSRIVVFPDGLLRLISRDVGLIIQSVELSVQIFGLSVETVMDLSDWDGLGTGFVVVAEPAVAVVRLGLQVIEVQIAVDSAIGHTLMLARRRTAHMGVHTEVEPPFRLRAAVDPYRWLALTGEHRSAGRELPAMDTRPRPGKPDSAPMSHARPILAP